MRDAGDPSRSRLLTESILGHVDTQSATLGTNRSSQPLPTASRAIVGFYTHARGLQNAFDTVF